MSIDAADVLAKLRHGDSEAFNAVYALYWKKLYFHAYKRVGTAELAEDMVQDVFFQFWLKRASLVITKSIESYLMGMLKNKILMHFREKYAASEKYDELVQIGRAHV